MAASISISAVKVTAEPWSNWWDINLDNETDVEDYLVVKDTGDNATAFTGYYRKSGGGSLLSMSEYDPDNQCSPFYETKAYSFDATNTDSGSITDHRRAITVADFSATNQESGYKINAPADTGERTVKIYTALYVSDANHLSVDCVATLNDGSSVTQTLALDGVTGVTHGGDQYLEIDVTYSADSDASNIDIWVKNTPSAGSGAIVAVQAAGAYVTTEAAPTGYSMDTTAGSYALTGSAASTLFNRVAQATAGAYSQAVSSAKSLYARVSQAVSGSYSLSGVSANTAKRMVLSTITGNFTGAYASTKTLLNRVINTNRGTYAVTGANAKLNPLRELVASAGSYVLSGVATNMITINKIAAAAGAYVLSAFSVDMAAQRLLHGGVGDYTVTGISADTSRTHNGFTLETTTGEYAISGTTTTINHDVPPPTTESVLVQMRRKGRR